MPCNTNSRADLQSDCSICLEAATGDIRQLECGHQFHTRCYNNWAQRCVGNITCPNCRAPSSDENGNNPRDPFNFAHHFRNNNVPYGMQHSGFDMPMHRLNSTREMTPAEVIIMIVVLVIAVVVLSIFTSVSSTCMCRLHWNPGQTHMIEKSFWGGQSVYTRPDMCTYVC